MKAIDEFNLLLEGQDLHEEMFLQLADMYLQDEAYSSAIDTLNRAIQKGFNTVKVNEGIAGKVFAEKKSIITNLGQNDPRFKQANIANNISSMICVPLIAKGEAIGVINITNKILDFPPD